VAFSAYDMGKLAAQKMFQIIAEEDMGSRATTLQPKLIERESTAKAR
jgi:DNA-binding LacI/PurR family transcriptional regulator